MSIVLFHAGSNNGEESAHVLSGDFAFGWYRGGDLIGPDSSCTIEQKIYYRFRRFTR